MSLVTIITAAYNCEQYIAQAIESVLQQTHTDWELLIADDGSGDATRSVIDRYAATDIRIKPHHNGANAGIVRTRNKLLKKATGRYITLLDGDDWIGKQKLECQVSFLQHSSFKAVGVNFYAVDMNGTAVINTRGIFNPVIQKKDIYRLPFWLPSVMIRSELLEQVGGYSTFFEDNACYEDLYWIYELLDKTDIAFINEPLYYCRHNPASVTKILNLKRLAGKELVNELICQRINTGTDWLKTGAFDEANAFMDNLLSNKAWAGSCYQTYAAIRLDENDTTGALHLLKKAFRLAPLNQNTFRTLFYYLRKKFVHPITKDVA